MRVTVDRSTRRPNGGGGVLARGLVSRLAARAEPMPVQHALAIIVSAASRVHAAHLAGGRMLPTPETVLIRFDGVVEVEPPSATGGDPREDVQALGRLLADLIAGAELPGAVAAVCTAIASSGRFVDAGPATAAELARALGVAAREAGIKLSRGELGRWARRQVHPPRLAHTLRRDDVPELGVDLGAVKPQAALADGSGEYAELLDDGAPLARSRSEAEAAAAAVAALAADEPADADDDFAVDVDLDDLIEVAVAPLGRAIVELPPVPVPRSIGTALVALLAVLIILGAAGVLIFHAY